MTEASIGSDGINVFVVYNGTCIAQRADPNTPQAGTWLSLEPSYRVFDKDYPAKLVVECEVKSSAISSPAPSEGGQAGLRGSDAKAARIVERPSGELACAP